MKFKTTLLFALGLSSSVQASPLYKCVAAIGNISATGFTKNAAIFATAKDCLANSNMPLLCDFSLVTCREVTNTAAYACQMFTGTQLITLSGTTEDDARDKVVAECESKLSIPSLCSSFTVKCLNLSE